MSRILPTLLATTAMAVIALALPMGPARAAGAFDGTWIIDVPADSLSGSGGEPTCPALRLGVQITDNQVSGNFQRAYPELENVVEDGDSDRATRVTGVVQPDGAMTAQWQNFHAAGQFVGNGAGLTVQSECGPLQARIWRLDEETTQTTADASSGSEAASSETQTASSASTSPSDGYNVYFAFDKSRLTTKGNGVVAAAVTAIRASQTSRVAVLGKADLAGTDPYNMALSQRRADRVHDAMVAGGVPADRIDVRWVGDREPPVPTAAGVRDAQNRVVEVTIQ